MAIILGVGGTAVVADNARPGDALFGVDQVVEKIELSLSGESRKDTLRLKFAQERVSEIKDIINEDREERNDGDVNNDTNDADDTDGDNDTNAPSTDDGVTGTEGVASQPDGTVTKESGMAVSDEKRADIEIGVQALASLLGDIENSELDQELAFIIQGLNSGIGLLPQDTKIEIRDDRFEIRNDDGRIRVDVKKDGEIRLKAETDKSGQDVSDDDDDSPDVASGTKSKIGLSEAEADIFTDITTVKVEISDTKTVFTTSARTKTAIIDEILKRFAGLTRLQVDALLEIEIENRASRADDLKLDSDSDDDDSDDDEDDRSRDNDSDDNRGGNNGQSGRSGRN